LRRTKKLKNNKLPKILFEKYFYLKFRRGWLPLGLSHRVIYKKMINEKERDTRDNERERNAKERHMLTLTRKRGVTV
jgi:hypothetical protein